MSAVGVAQRIAVPAGTVTTSVVDVHALYQIATGHTPAAAQVRRSALDGGHRLLCALSTLSVASSMRTCWETDCERPGHDDPQPALRELLDAGVLQTIASAPDTALAAGSLYGEVTRRGPVGAEVLSACHALLLARELHAPLLSTARAAYCYAWVRPVSLVDQLCLV